MSTLSSSTERGMMKMELERDIIQSVLTSVSLLLTSYVTIDKKKPNKVCFMCIVFINSTTTDVKADWSR